MTAPATPVRLTHTGAGPLRGQTGTLLSHANGWCVVELDDQRTIVVSKISEWARAIR